MVDDENTENGPEESEEPDEAVESEQTPEDAAAVQEEALTAHGWVTDGNGNPLTSSPPARPLIMGHRFYKFDYVGDEVNSDTIHPTEDVYAVIEYPGSKRRGASLAYPAGTAIPKVILDNIEEDLSGRHGPSHE